MTGTEFSKLVLWDKVVFYPFMQGVLLASRISSTQRDVVPVSQYFFLCFSHGIYCVQYGRLDFPENTKITFDNNVAHCLLLVCAGYLEWLGLLPLYRLALGCKKKTGL